MKSDKNQEQIYHNRSIITFFLSLMSIMMVKYIIDNIDFSRVIQDNDESFSKKDETNEQQ